jgi:hypothetical protein
MPPQIPHRLFHPFKKNKRPNPLILGVYPKTGMFPPITSHDIPSLWAPATAPQSCRRDGEAPKYGSAHHGVTWIARSLESIQVLFSGGG